MLSIRKIRNKIRTVNNIQKITRAMEMVSAAKLRRVQDRMIAIRPYVNKLQDTVHNLVASLGTGPIKHPLMKTTDLDSTTPTPRGASVTGKPIIAITLAGDKGLCGSYNTNLMKEAVAFFNRPEWSSIKLVAIGRKVIDYFTKHPLDKLEIVSQYNRLSVDINQEQIREVAQPIIHSYLKGQGSEVWLIYTTYVNAMVYRPQITRLLPISITAPALAEHQELSVERPRSPGLAYEYLYEPKPQIMLELLLPKYLDLLFYRTILEALASEQSARMMAMRNATDNAEEVSYDLKLTLNKARQAGITKELLDIVGGVEAMKG